MKNRILAICSDPHCGSDVGLCPPECYTPKGNLITFGENVIQQWLWESWGMIWKRAYKIIGNDSFNLLVNGDAVEGLHHKQKDLALHEKEEHCAAAVEVFKPIVKRARKTFFVRGTECHTENMEAAIAHELKAEFCGDVFQREFCGVPVEAKHHIGTTSRAHLEATALGVTMGNIRMNCVRSGHVVPRVMIRGHRHTHGYYSDGESMIVVTSAWQMLTRHGFKVVPDSIPRPSIILLDWRTRLDGELPVVHELIIPAPAHDYEKL